jgi:CHAT domain-containing protein
LEDNARALEYFQLALDRAAIYSQTKATALNSIGEIFETMGQPQKALVYYGQALHLYKVIEDPMGQASILNHLGSLSQASGKHVEALKHYRKALALSRSVQDPNGEASALLKIASALLAGEEYVEARSQIETAIQIVESLRMNVASQDSRASYLASTHKYYELYVDILMRLDQRNPNQGLAATAFEVSERGRARSFLESLREARSDIHEGIDASLSEQHRRLGRELNIKAERHLQLVANKKTDLAKVVAKEIDQITAEYREVRAQIRLKNPRYAALTEPHPISLKEIQQQVLDDDSLLLEYMLGDHKSYLWAITRTEVATFELPGRATIEQSARSVYALLTANQPLPDEKLEQTEARVAKANQQLSSQIADLSRILIEPVAAKLGTKRLLIVADGALQYLPFQILNEPTPRSATESGTHTKVDRPAPLVAAHEIVNEPSASALALLISQTKNRIPATNSVAVLADPVFDADDPRIKSARTINTNAMTALVPEGDLNRAVRDVPSIGTGSRIPRLLASLDEAKAITSTAPWWSSFQATGFEANRTTAMNPKLGDYRFVHFATHGLLNDEHPELSGIVLSLVDETGQPQDGFLRLHDIYNLHLPVDLVVLSACNTGLGKDVKGEGLIGLTRGFMYAGASSVVASLWKVDDEATAELMNLFYAAMFQEGLSPAAALRKAQLKMSQRKRWESPYYWSGFIIQGQFSQTQRPAYFSPNKQIAFAALAAILALSAFFIWKRRRSTHL